MLKGKVKRKPRTMTPYYDHSGITIYHGDCLEGWEKSSGIKDERREFERQGKPVLEVLPE